MTSSKTITPQKQQRHSKQQQQYQSRQSQGTIQVQRRQRPRAERNIVASSSLDNATFLLSFSVVVVVIVATAMMVAVTASNAASFLRRSPAAALFKANNAQQLSRRQLLVSFNHVFYSSVATTSNYSSSNNYNSTHSNSLLRVTSFSGGSSSSSISSMANKPQNASFSTTSSSSSSSSQSFSEKAARSFQETPLGSRGAFLLKGLDVHHVPAMGDGHPLSVYGIYSNTDTEDLKQRPPILLLHGRTWSAVPVYHLHPDGWDADTEEEEEELAAAFAAKATGSGTPTTPHSSRSLMEALYKYGLQPYCMDFRGFGGTPHDETGYVEPNRCVEDTESVLEWIAQRHGLTDHQTDNNPDKLPTLLGWSQGALIAQLVAQRSSHSASCAHHSFKRFLSKVILYGSIYDPSLRYPREPLYVMSKPNRTMLMNAFDDAIEDFTLEGTIPPETARQFANSALITDPIKAQWRYLYQFNNCDPARITMPTLVLAGDQDPYAPLHVQGELFMQLGRGSDRKWCILAECDHAVHLLEHRHRMIRTVVNFVGK